ncbi:MAG: BrnT family toxin [Magnetococcus sp. YQC-5]
MKITYDSAKRDKTLAERGLDFADAHEVFFGPEFTFPDSRKE